MDKLRVNIPLPKQLDSPISPTLRKLGWATSQVIKDYTTYLAELAKLPGEAYQGKDISLQEAFEFASFVTGGGFLSRAGIPTAGIGFKGTRAFRSSIDDFLEELTAAGTKTIKKKSFLKQLQRKVSPAEIKDLNLTSKLASLGKKVDLEDFKKFVRFRQGKIQVRRAADYSQYTKPIEKPSPYYQEKVFTYESPQLMGYEHLPTAEHYPNLSPSKYIWTREDILPVTKKREFPTTAQERYNKALQRLVETKRSYLPYSIEGQTFFLHEIQRPKWLSAILGEKKVPKAVRRQLNILKRDIESKVADIKKYEAMLDADFPYPRQIKGRINTIQEFIINKQKKLDYLQGKLAGTKDIAKSSYELGLKEALYEAVSPSIERPPVEYFSWATPAMQLKRWNPEYKKIYEHVYGERVPTELKKIIKKATGGREPEIIKIKVPGRTGQLVEVPAIKLEDWIKEAIKKGFKISKATNYNKALRAIA